MNKKLLFSLTKKDFRFDYYRASGKGGQKRNKTASAVRCTHEASGAVGNATKSRSQHVNKQTAFRRMAESAKFKAWHKLETAKRMGLLADIEEIVEREMRKIKVEVRENDKWVRCNNEIKDI